MDMLTYRKEPSLEKVGNSDLLFELRRRVYNEVKPGSPEVAQLSLSQIICEIGARNRNSELNEIQDKYFMDLLLSASKLKEFQTELKPSPDFVDLSTDSIVNELVSKLEENSENFLYDKAFAELKARLNQGKLENHHIILLVVLMSMRELRRPVATASLPPIIPSKPAPEAQKETLAAEVLRSIERWSIQGRVRVGTVLNGNQISQPDSSVSHGPNAELFSKFKDSILNRFVVFINAMDPSLRSLVNSQYLSVVASDREGYLLWDYCFFQEGKGMGSRGEQYTPVSVRFELPTETSKKLWLGLGTNPDIIDEIYTRGFPGAEDSAQGLAGFRRVKSNKLYLAQHSNFRDFHLSPWTSQLLGLREKLIERTFKVPHGIGDPMPENYFVDDIEKVKLQSAESRVVSQTASVPPEAPQPPVVEKPKQVKDAAIRHPENPRATEYIKQITRSFARGKVRAGTSINGKIITRPNGYNDHGKDVDLAAAASNNFEGRLQGAIRTYRVDNAQYVNSDVLVVKPSDVRGRMIWQLNFFQDETKAVEADRGISPAYVVWELPEAQSRMLWSEMTTNPDMIGDIFRQAFVGLEDPDPENEAPLGMRRIRTNRLYVADQKVLNKIPDGYIGPKDIDTYMGEFYRLQYQHPQGVGDPLPDKLAANQVQSQIRPGGRDGMPSAQERSKRKENPLAEQIARHITRSAVHAKLFEGSMVNGVPIKKARDYATHGVNPELYEECNNEKLRALFAALSQSSLQVNLPHLFNSQFLTLSPSIRNKGSMIWRLTSAQDSKGADIRGSMTDLYWELPRAQTEVLWNAMNSDPDILQDVIARAFSGIEGDNGTQLLSADGKPLGMRRIKANTVYVANVAQIDKLPMLHNFSPNGEIEKAINNFIAVRYRSGPYGVGDPIPENPKR